MLKNSKQQRYNDQIKMNCEMCPEPVQMVIPLNVEVFNVLKFIIVGLKLSSFSTYAMSSVEMFRCAYMIRTKGNVCSERHRDGLLSLFPSYV